jgi:hypothetical protein
MSGSARVRQRHLGLVRGLASGKVPGTEEVVEASCGQYQTKTECVVA